MKAVVMAGGFGTRIQPLTHSLPKPMLPILNIPMMQYMIEKVRDVGVKDVIVLLYFKPEVIQNYFKDGKEFGVNITYILPDDDYGTAGAVKKAQKYLDETFFIVSGDLVTDFDFKEIIAFHRKKHSKLTITLTSVEDPLQFGVVITDPNGKIQKFLEKPSWGEVFSDTINTGIYVLEPEILDYIPEDENYDFGKQLFPNLMKAGVTLWGCTLKGHWRDVGNPESYREAHKEILHGKVNVGFRGEKIEFKNGVVYAPKSIKLPEDIEIEGVVVLDRDVKIEKGVKLKNVVIGANSSISKDCEIVDSVIWDNVEIGEKSILHSCVICDKNKLDKKVVAKSGAIIAENCEIGKLTHIEKDVIIWPDKIIEEASVISNNIIWGNKYKSSIFEGGKVIGRTNIELSCEIATKLAESFGSMLPVGSRVYVSRDYHRSSRMIKRAFLGGLLSTGINVDDVKLVPSNVMRYNLARNDEIVAGIHVRQSVENQMYTEILFFTSEGLAIDTNTEKNCERLFFRESFRRVNYDEIGEIREIEGGLKANYKKGFFENVDKDVFKNTEIKVAVDLLFGSTFSIYPEIINGLNIENVVLNAYLDDKKLSKLPSFIKKSEEDVSRIVKSLDMDIGFLIYPNGQKLHIVSNEGEILSESIALLVVLDLLDKCCNEKSKVYLPVYSPDIMDREFKNLEIERGKFSSLSASKLRQYNFVGNISGNYAFTQFALNYDSLFASIKILEMLAKQGKKISQIVKEIPKFYFKAEKIECPSNLKGKMMRKFMEDSKGKEASHLDGVKIWIDEHSWVLMIPPQTGEYVNLYVQSDKTKTGEAIFKEYTKKIAEWQKSND